MTGREPGPRHVREALGRVTAALGMPAPGALATVFGHWEEIVGTAFAAHVRPRSLTGARLVVVADDPVWAAQVRFLEAHLLGRIAAVAGPGVCDRVEVRVGRG